MPLKLLDLTRPSPEENVAFDEILLDQCEGGEAGGVLRLWEARSSVVVAGFSNRIEREVNLDACDRLGIPVFRRSSGGGAVLLGPGCLNYALVLPLDAAPDLSTVDGTNAYVLERHRSAFARIVGDGVRVQCCTDLALGDRKFSGNAQRRRRRAVLFHGTFLLNMDLSLVEACLPMPSRQPPYRRGRAHGDFLANLGIGAAEAKAALAEAWVAAPGRPD